MSNKRPSSFIELLILFGTFLIGLPFLSITTRIDNNIGLLLTIILLVSLFVVGRILCNKYSDYVYQSNQEEKANKECTICFITNDYIISSKTYPIGERITDIPQMPELVLIDGKRHHFKGWSPELCEVVTKDQKYIAVYQPE